MTSTEAIKALINVPEQKIRRIATKHEQLTTLLDNAPLIVAGLARLLFIATQYEDFDLKGKGKLMITKSFFGSFVQLTNEGCAAFVLASEQFSEIQMTSDRMPDKVRDVLDNIADDEMRKQTTEALAENANSCATSAKTTFDKFSMVSSLMDEIKDQMTSTKNSIGRGLSIATKQALPNALTDGIQQLSVIREKWSRVATFFSKISAKELTAAKVSKELQRDISRISMVSCIPHSPQLRNYAKKATKMCLLPIRMSALASVFASVSSMHLEEKIRELSGLVPEAKNNRESFEALEKQCLDSGEDIKQIFATSKTELLDKLKDEIELLKG